MRFLQLIHVVCLLKDFQHCVSTRFFFFFPRLLWRQAQWSGGISRLPPSLSHSVSCLLSATLQTRSDLQRLAKQTDELSKTPSFTVCLSVWQTDADRPGGVMGLLHTNMRWTKTVCGVQRAHETENRQTQTPEHTWDDSLSTWPAFRGWDHGPPPPFLFPLLPLLFFLELSVAAAGRGGV